MGKYLFYDVDGTLVGKSQRITTLKAEALHTARKNGHKAFLCTGRAYLGVMRGLDGLEVDGMISHAGSVVNIGSKIIYEHDIDLSLLRRVRDLFEAHHMEYTLESKDGNFHTPGLQRFYLNWIDEHFAGDEATKTILKADKIGKNQYYVGDFEETKNPVHKFNFLAWRREDFEAVQDELSRDFHIHLFYNLAGENAGVDGELIPKDCTKAHGMEELLAYYHADIKDTVAFGDSANDFQMISCAGMGVVHIQAPTELKKYAAATFDDPDKDGIYHVMRQLKLI